MTDANENQSLPAPFQGIPPELLERQEVQAILVENWSLKSVKGTQSTAAVFQSAFRWAGLAFIAWCAYRSVDALAGKTTAADIVVKFLADVRVHTAIAWSCGVGGIAYGWRQRALRKRTVEQLQGRLKELEAKIDPNRTSSELTVRGDTREEDR